MRQVGLFAVVNTEFYDAVLSEITSLPDISVLHRDTRTGKTIFMISGTCAVRQRERLNYIRGHRLIRIAEVIFSFNDVQSEEDDDLRNSGEDESTSSQHWKTLFYVEH